MNPVTKHPLDRVIRVMGVAEVFPTERWPRAQHPRRTAKAELHKQLGVVAREVGQPDVAALVTDRSCKKG